MTLSFDPKEDREYTDEQARELWTEARRMAQAGDCDFCEWRFPADPDADEYGEGFSGITFSGDADYERAIFCGTANFQETKFKKVGFQDAVFKGDVNFFDSEFHGTANFFLATFQGATDFREAIDFRDAKFKGDATFNDAIFNRDTDFDGATFSKAANFIKTAFSGNASFYVDKFSNAACFESAIFEKNAWFFLLPQRPFKSWPFRNPKDAVVIYRLAKQAAQVQGNFQMAAHYNYAERCARNTCKFKEVFSAEEGYLVKESRTIKKGFRRIKTKFCMLIAALSERIFVQYLFGYSEKPLRPLIVGVFIILFWAFLFYHLDGIEPAKPNGTCPFLGAVETLLTPEKKQAETPRRSRKECLYFSIVTFTTLGYGDLRPTNDWPYRFLAGSEAMLGMAIMSLFIVCLARKYTR